MLRLRTRLAVAAVLLVGIAVFGQLWLPRWVEDRIEAGMRRSFTEVQWVNADVRAVPAYVLLGGRMNSVNLDARRVALGDLMVDAVLLDGRNVVVNMPKLLSGRGVEVRSADYLKATFVIAEDDLNRYFWEQVNHSQFFRVDLERGQAVLRGRLNLLGREMDVRVAGVFEANGGNRISFVPKEVTVDNARVPQLLLDMIAREWSLSLELDQDAIPLEITDLMVEDGKLLIYGTQPRRG